MRKLLLTTILFGALAQAVSAEPQPFRLDMCDDRNTSGWSFYCRPPVEPEEEQLLKRRLPHRRPRQHRNLLSRK